MKLLLIALLLLFAGCSETTNPSVESFKDIIEGEWQITSFENSDLDSDGNLIFRTNDLFKYDTSSYQIKFKTNDYSLIWLYDFGEPAIYYCPFPETSLIYKCKDYEDVNDRIWEITISIDSIGNKYHFTIFNVSDALMAENIYRQVKLTGYKL